MASKTGKVPPRAGRETSKAFQAFVEAAFPQAAKDKDWEHWIGQIKSARAAGTIDADVAFLHLSSALEMLAEDRTRSDAVDAEQRRQIVAAVMREHGEGEMADLYLGNEKEYFRRRGRGMLLTAKDEPGKLRIARKLIRKIAVKRGWKDLLFELELSRNKTPDEAEIRSMVKEWAILLADEYVRLNKADKGAEGATGDAYIIFREFIRHAFVKLSKQAEAKYPGAGAEDIQACRKLKQALYAEFHALKLLIVEANEAIPNQAERAAQEAMLKIATLYTILLLDAIGRTARTAAAWIEAHEAEGEDEKIRQKILKELEFYMTVYFGERFSDSIPLGNIRIRAPSLVEMMVEISRNLILDAYRYYAAVEYIEKTIFDGHQVLAPSGRDRINQALDAVEMGVKSLDDYFSVRDYLFREEWDHEEQHEGGYVTAIPGEREGRLKIDLKQIQSLARREAKELAKQWLKEARKKATLLIRQLSGEEDAFFDACLDLFELRG